MAPSPPTGERRSEADALRAQRAALHCRSDTLQAIRRFFHERDFLEIETPVRLRAPALELHLDAEPSGPLFLRTSPELHMKRLLGAGYERLFQMGPCFRRGERGERHHPEYTMLEWYRAQADYRAILSDTRDLLRAVAVAVRGEPRLAWQGRTIDLEAPWTRYTVQEAFLRWAGWDPVAHYDADRFDLDLVDRVEPALANAGAPCVLIDYPVEAAALARRRPGQPEVAERWELYVGGMELANAYSELTDPVEQAARFADCAERRRAAGRTVYPLDEEFLAMLRQGMPPSGGIALGVDRLVMLLADVPDIGGVTAFRETDP